MAKKPIRNAQMIIKENYFTYLYYALNAIGVFWYIRWGWIHIKVGYDPLNALSKGGDQAFINQIIPNASWSAENEQLAVGLLEQHHYNMLFFGIFAIVIALIYNLRGRLDGFLLNALVIGAVDYAFLVAVVNRIGFSIPPPIYWYIYAVIFTALGLIVKRLVNVKKRNRQEVSTQP
ncbi:MAG: hypothetical protein QNJ57_00845 [Flavobacteriaceae bacterium]|nr:hypothetical protein [Flavobacteriaceae bacterium]